MTAQAGAGIDGDLHAGLVDSNAPGEENFRFTSRAKVKDAGVLQEEGPFLGKEQVEAGEVDLLFVHFHLSEVGIKRRIQRKRRRQAVFHIQTGVAGELALILASRVVLVQSTQNVGNQLHVPVHL